MKSFIQTSGRAIAQYFVAGAIWIPAVVTHGAGRLVVSHDDLVMSDTGFHIPADPATFAHNLAKWFSPIRPGRFLALSDSEGLAGSALSNAMASAGHTWVVSTATPLTLADLFSYDGVFLCAHPVPETVLADYINAGGNVYIAGVGVASDDRSKWNPFLQRFGLAFSEIGTGNGSSGVGDFPIDSEHPLFSGVDYLYGVNGTAVIDLEPDNSANRVLIRDGERGLFAVWEDGSAYEYFDSTLDFGSAQGGITGTWLYEEFDGIKFANLTFRPEGNSFAGGQPAWTGANTALPLLFRDSEVPNGLVFHPGIPGAGPQPSRHDISLGWVALKSGDYAISGFVRGDGRIGIGGDGFDFSIFHGSQPLLEISIEPADKSNHRVSVRSVRVKAGEKISFRVSDRGNNEFDYGVFNLRIRPQQPQLQIRVSEVELCWVASSNVTSRLEYRSALTDESWRLLGTNEFVGDGSFKCVYDTVPFGEPQRFYRVVTNGVVKTVLTPR